MYPIFTIFGKSFGVYGLCAVIGLLAAGSVCVLLGKRVAVTLDHSVIFLLTACGGLLIGGHLLYGIVNLDVLVSCMRGSSSPTVSEMGSALVLTFGGNVFYGGMLGAFVALKLFSYRFTKIPSRVSIELFAVCTPLFHVFGRIGCFFGGCCYGVPSAIGFTAAYNPIVPELGGVCRFPVQLVEALGDLLIFLLLLYCFLKQYHRYRLFFVYLCLYAPMRFVLEFWRGDLQRGMWFGLSTSQWIGLMILIVLFALFVVGRTKRKVEQHE